MRHHRITVRHVLPDDYGYTLSTALPDQSVRNHLSVLRNVFLYNGGSTWSTDLLQGTEHGPDNGVSVPVPENLYPHAADLPDLQRNDEALSLSGLPVYEPDLPDQSDRSEISNTV